MTDLSRWPALVLCAGLGTRLAPLSSVRAKAALPVANEPLVRRILRWLARAGVTRAVVNLHHRPETVARVVGDGSDLGIEVRYSWERRVLGSAGGPARALPLLDADRFLIVNGDTLTNLQPGEVVREHLQTHARVTMACVDADLSKYNALLADTTGIVRGVSARGSPGTLAPWHHGTGAPGHSGTLTALHFIGVQAVEAAVFAGVSPDEPSETVHGFYRELIDREPGSIRVHRSGAEFFDIGTPRDYLDTSLHLAAREGVPLVPGAACHIDATARVERTVVWDNVTIGAGAHLEECVVADNVVVPPGAALRRVVLVENQPPWNL